MENKFIRYSELSDYSKGFTLTSNVYVDNAVDIIMKSLMIGFTLGIFTYFVITKAIGIDGTQSLLFSACHMVCFSICILIDCKMRY